MDTPTQNQTYPAPVGHSLYGWTGGQKAGWFFVGFFGGLVGILVASLTNTAHPDRSTATKMAIIGCVTCVALALLSSLFVGCSTAALIAGASY